MQVHAHLEESSQICGAPPITTMRHIVAPLVLPGSEVLALRILNFADDGLWGKLSVPGIVMIVLSTGRCWRRP